MLKRMQKQKLCFMFRTVNTLLFFFLLCTWGKTALCQNDVTGVRMDSCLSQPFHHYHFPGGYIHGKNPLNSAPIEYGVVNLKSGDTFTGLISFYKPVGRYFDVAVLPDSGVLQGYLLQFYGNKTGALRNSTDGKIDVSNFRIYQDSINKNCYSDFVHLPDYNKAPNFWRILGKIDNVEVVDKVRFRSHLHSNDWKSFAYLGRRKMLLITKDGYAQIYRRILFRNVNKSICRFINKRYHTSFRKTNFKSTGAMIDYILDKENEKQ